jgi:hypothetical protein
VLKVEKREGFGSGKHTRPDRFYPARFSSEARKRA